MPRGSCARYDRSIRGHEPAPLLLWCLILLLVCGTVAHGADTSLGQAHQGIRFQPRNLQFTTLTLYDGLSQATINAIAQDRHGYIWVGTQEGLNRYDGNNIVVFGKELDNPASLAHDWVWDLLLDRSGSLWVATDGGGLSRFDSYSQSFTHYQNTPGDPFSVSNNRVRALAEDRSGYIWVGTDGGGLNRLDPRSGNVIRYLQDPRDQYSLVDIRIYALYEDRSGTLWIGTDGKGLLRYDRDSGTFLAYRHDPSQPDSLGDDRVRAILEDNKGRLWVGTSGAGVSVLDPQRKGFRHHTHDPLNPYSLGKGAIRDIRQDSSGALWVATESGLCEWIQGLDLFRCYSHDATDRSTLPDNRITQIFEDDGGVLWVGTYAGIARWNYVSDAFRYFRKDARNGSGLSHNLVTSVDVSRDGTFWLGTLGGGLNHLDPTPEESESYRNDPADPTSLSSDLITAVHVSADGMVWAGTRDAGLNRIDPVTGKVRHYLNDRDGPMSIGRKGITRIHSDPDGTLWVGIYRGGLGQLNPKTGRLTLYRNEPDDSSSISSDRVLAILRDRSGQLWIGTEDGGLNRLDAQTGSFTRYKHDPTDPESLASNSVYDLLEGADGSLWLASAGGGVSRWMLADRQLGRNVFRRYNKQSVLVSNTVLGLLEDEDGGLWMSRNGGISRLDPDNGTIRHFDDRNGLRGNEHMQGARCRTPDGELAFGGTQGLVVFDPEQIRMNLHPPKIAVTVTSNLGVLDRSFSTDDEMPAVKLSFKDYTVSFELAALDFASPDKNRFQYMLEGFDPAWVDSGPYRRATYTNLPAKTYRFLVKAANNDGIWSEEYAAVALAVEPPPWRSTWAITLYVTLVLGSVGRFVHSQRRKSALEAEQRHLLETMVEERTREISERNKELEILNDKLEEVSATDTLTGLKNRRYFYSYIESEIAKIDRQVADIGECNGPIHILPGLFFMMIDLDGFKLINDTYGHGAGDQALLQVRDVLRKCCRSADTIIRWGGDEFLIVGQAGSRHAVEKLAERIRHELAAHQYQLGKGNVGHLSGSMGFVLYPFVPGRPDVLGWEATAAIADQASYIAKENQRNAWVGIYCTGKHLSADISLRIRDDLGALLALGLIEIRTSIKGELARLSEKLERAEV